MVETIDKIRSKISKLLIRISELEKSLVQKDEDQLEFVRDYALKLIKEREELEKDFKRNYAQANSDLEKEIEKARYESFDGRIERLLQELDVFRMAAPLDTLADFIKIVDTVKSEKRRNGQVMEVLKPGYMLGDDLLRPSHVIVVKND